jgi:hypothetical protein
MRFSVVTLAVLVATVSALPQSNGQNEGPCPVIGAMECQGSGFITCDDSGWIYRDCGPGTTCYCIPETGGLFCGYPAKHL